MARSRPDPGGIGRAAAHGPAAPKGGAGSSGVGAGSPGKLRSVALFQHVSQATLEEGARGVFAGLEQAGYQEGRTLAVRRYCAEGDAATANTIAREIIGGDSELVITLSTPSLQAIAAANRDAKRLHVFGLVSDPVVAGVGISRDDPRKHPSYMVGLGTMQPVADVFKLARRLNPALKKVGVAWNPSEANSEACTKVARAVCKELEIELLEANVDGSAAVREAVGSLIGRGAEAIWVGGDNVVLSSLDAVIGPTRAARVAVFTSIPGCAERGALFDLGADYHRVGISVGQLAGRVLDGESPADMPILYEVPPELWINRVALKLVGGDWSFPAEIDAKADVVVESGGPVRRQPREATQPAANAPARPSRAWKLTLAAFSESTILEETIDGLKRGLKEGGVIDGRDFTMVERNAQGDIATLNAMFDELDGDDTDLIVSFSTPALQSALRKVDAEADCLRRRARSVRCGSREERLGAPSECDGRLPYVPLRPDGPAGSRHLSQGPPRRHALHTWRGQFGPRPAAVRAGDQGCRSRAGQPTRERSVRSQRRRAFALPVGRRRRVPDLRQPEQRIVPGDHPRVRNGQDAALHVLALDGQERGDPRDRL